MGRCVYEDLWEECVGRCVGGGKCKEVCVWEVCIGTIRERCGGGVSEEVGVYMYEGGMCVGEVCVLGRCVREEGVQGSDVVVCSCNQLQLHF